MKKMMNAEMASEIIRSRSHTHNPGRFAGGCAEYCTSAAAVVVCERVVSVFFSVSKASAIRPIVYRTAGAGAHSHRRGVALELQPFRRHPDGPRFCRRGEGSCAYQLSTTREIPRSA